MAEAPQDEAAEMAQLPPVGTAERREWDRTIRQANELYPDWSWIRIGRARFGRRAYEEHSKGYDTETGRRRRSPSRSLAGS